MSKSVAYRLLSAQDKFPASRVDFVNVLFNVCKAHRFENLVECKSRKPAFRYSVWKFPDESIIVYDAKTDIFDNDYDTV